MSSSTAMRPPRQPAAPSGPTENVARLLLEASDRAPAVPALIGPDGRTICTVAELAGTAALRAAALARRGLTPGGRVVVMVRAPHTALAAVVATIWAGGAAVIPPRTRGLRRALRSAAATEPQLVVTDSVTRPLALLDPVLRRRAVTYASLARAAPVALPVVARDGGSAALVTFTTGTTGDPQPVVRSHRVLAAQHAGIALIRPATPDDVDLVTLPAMALHDLAAGVRFIFAPTGLAAARSAPAAGRLRAIVARTGVTLAAGFPATFEILVAGAQAGELRQLRLVRVGGAAVRPELLERLADVAPEADVAVVYGMTEAEPIAVIAATEYVDLLRGGPAGRGLPVGRVVPGIEMRVVPLSGGGRRGRIMVRGQRVVHVPSRTDEEGWLDTGDSGWIDDEERIWLLGRTSNVAPGPLFPAEVEEPVGQLPGVAEAALVILDTPGGVGRPVLVLERDAGRRGARRTSVPDLRAAAHGLIEQRGWQIEQVEAVDRLPRDRRSGTKLDYGRLRRGLRQAVSR